MSEDTSVEQVLTAYIAKETLDSTKVMLLVPICTSLERLDSAARDISILSEEVFELLCYCVGISRCLFEAAIARDTPPQTWVAVGEFKAVMDDVSDFLRAHDSPRMAHGQWTPYPSEHGTVVKHKERLNVLLQGALALSSAGSSLEAKAESREPKRRLTFVSHAGEEKPFVLSLLRAIENVNVATFFDDDMSVGDSSENEMITRAAEADQAVVVLSRAFLTKKWPMKELNIMLENEIRVYPLYYRVTPDELGDIVAAYDRQAFHVLS